MHKYDPIHIPKAEGLSLRLARCSCGWLHETAVPLDIATQLWVAHKEAS